MGQLGATLLLRAANDWRLDRPAPDRKLPVVAVSLHARSTVERLIAEYPFLTDACTFDCHDIDVRAPEFHRGDFLRHDLETPVRAAHVCLGDDALAVLASVKESNRQQAEHVRTKLHAVGCQDIPREVFDGPLLEFTPDEVETLARLEHERWVAERLRAGWRLGPVKDHEQKVSPYLVPWDQLWDQVKEYHGNTIRTLPLVLAKADNAIERGL